MNNCDIPCACSKLNLGPLQKMLLTTDPSFQSQIPLFLTNYKHFVVLFMVGHHRAWRYTAVHLGWQLLMSKYASLYCICQFKDSFYEKLLMNLTLEDCAFVKKKRPLKKKLEWVKPLPIYISNTPPKPREIFIPRRGWNLTRPNQKLPQLPAI